MIEIIKKHFQNLKDGNTYRFEEYSETGYESISVGYAGQQGWLYWFESYDGDIRLYGKPFDLKSFEAAR